MEKGRSRDRARQARWKEVKFIFQSGMEWEKKTRKRGRMGRAVHGEKKERR